MSQFFQRKLLKASFLFIRCGSTFLVSFWLAFKWSARTFRRSNFTPLPLRLSSEQSGVLKESFFPLFTSFMYSETSLDNSSSSFLSFSSMGNINRFLIFDPRLAPDGTSRIILRCKRFFFGAHKICWAAKAALSSVGGVTWTSARHSSIFFLPNLTRRIRRVLSV